MCEVCVSFGAVCNAPWRCSGFVVDATDVPVVVKFEIDTCTDKLVLA